MSPIVRGRAIAQIESSGRTKKTFDVLLWCENLSRKGFRKLDELQQLRDYLGTIHPSVTAINLWLPTEFGRILTFLNGFAITTSGIAVAVPSVDIEEIFGKRVPAGMHEAAATALCCDADMVITENSDWYPYYNEFEKIGLLLGSPDVILRQAEIFVRGHDIPWAFSDPMFDAPWGPFYFFGEKDTLVAGQKFLDLCQKKGVDGQTQEIGRSLVFNRIPNILFTRDRLLFYEMQQAVAKRAEWTRQKFQFEVGYYLNFYYILLYGAFDHIAVLLNGVLRLGLPIRDVKATGEAFLRELKRLAPEVQAMFTEVKIVDFIDRIASLRHASAHRSQIMPAPVYEKADHEPTKEELDDEIRARGLDRELEFFPVGALREGMRESIRFKLKMEKLKILIEDAVYLDTKKQKGFINPLIDTEWNFSKFYAFYTEVLKAVMKRI